MGKSSTILWFCSLPVLMTIMYRLQAHGVPEQSWTAATVVSMGCEYRIIIVYPIYIYFSTFSYFSHSSYVWLFNIIYVLSAMDVWSQSLIAILD